MAINQTEDIKTFRNPSGYWEHDGAFSVELTHDADKSIVPPSAEVQDNIVSVRHGCIRQVMGGIQFYSQENPFHLSYSQIRVIRNKDGKLLWVNDSCR